MEVKNYEELYPRIRFRQKRQKENEKANERTKKILQDEFKIQNPSRDDIQKYNMWQECKAYPENLR